MIITDKLIRGVVFGTFGLYMLVNMSLAQAQQKGVEDETIIVVKAYQATLSDAFKINATPTRDTSIFKTPELKYGISSTKASTEYLPIAIKAVRIKDENIPKLYKSYVKAGFGNFSTPYGELFVNSLRSKKFTAGTHLKHLSSTGIIKNYGYPAYSDNDANVFAKKFFDRQFLEADVNFNRDVFHFYGYNLDDTVLTRKQTRQELNYLDGSIRFRNFDLKKYSLDHNIGVKFYSQNDDFKHKESAFIADVEVGRDIESVYANLKMEFDFSNQKDTTKNEYKNNIVKIGPSARMKFEKLQLDAGIDLVFANNGKSGADVSVYPDVKIEYPVVDNFVVFSAALKGDIRKNTLHTLLSENNFYVPQNGVANTQDKFDFQAGLRGTFSSRISYTSWVRYTNSNNAVFFVNDTSTIVDNTFKVLYDDVDLLNIHGEIGYHTAERMRLVLRADYFGYSMTKLAEPWHKPSFTLGLTSKYNMAEKILISVDVFGSGIRKALVYDAADLPSAKELNGFADINLGLEYRYSKILSVYLNVNNIAAAKYARYYDYSLQRFQVLGGFTYSF